MHTQLTILKKGLALISIPLLVQAVFIIVLVKAQADHARVQQLAVHTKEVIAKIEETHRSLIEAYSGARGRILTGDPSTAEPDREALGRIPGQVAGLQGQVVDNDRQRARTRDLATRADAFLGWITEEDRLVRSGHPDRALAEADRGAGLLKAVRMTLDEVLHEEERLDKDRMEHLRESSGHQVGMLIGGGAAIVVSTLILALLFLQGIVQRLGVLRDNARRFAAGRPLRAHLAGRDEITEVDRAFHDMADTLGRQKQENEMFVYSVSHDLRSPLVNLLGFSEELGLSCRDLTALLQGEDVPEGVRRRGLELLSRDVEESIRFIQTAVGRLARIIDSLLRLSRAGRVEYQWQSIDVAAVVRKIVEALHDTISARKAEIELGELPVAWGDPTAVERIFANLIGNAVQYLDPARPGRIEVGSSDDLVVGKPAGLRVYYVKDNGLGIPEAYHPRMFTAFHRLHVDVAQGEGIGLALVRRMVERHGGRIWLDSSPGVGTTFFVALPAGPEAGAAPGVGEPSPATFEPVETIPHGHRVALDRAR
jgi:signal transduction histidine kinase